MLTDFQWWLEFLGDENLLFIIDLKYSLQDDLPWEDDSIWEIPYGDVDLGRTKLA